MPKAFISSWDEHVESWTNNSFNIPKLIIKYEDLIEDKEKTIKIINNFFELNLKIKTQNFNYKLKNIINTTSFNKMQAMENTHGFIEANDWSRFFHKGTKNQWKDKLSKEQTSKIENKFKKQMIKFNYEIS